MEEKRKGERDTEGKKKKTEERIKAEKEKTLRHLGTSNYDTT